MNNPTSAEREALTSRLRSAVPNEPDLWGLAARAESAARRNRTRRRTVVAVAACGVAAGVVAPQLLGSQAAQQPRFRSPTAAPAHPCSGTPDHRDFTKGKAVWATFCPTKQTGTDHSTPAGPHGVLTKGVADLVSAWQQASGPVHSCPYQAGVTHFTVRVGFADGTTTTIRGETGGCQTSLSPRFSGVEGPDGARVYADLVHALRDQNGGGHQHGEPSGPDTTAAAPSPSSGTVQPESTAATVATVTRH